MAKFYVASGKIQEIVTANDSYSAALWAMHLVMEQILPVDDIDWVLGEKDNQMAYTDGMDQLGKTINVSEIGFGRNEAGQFQTVDALCEWNQLIIAMSQLDKQLDDDNLANHLDGESKKLSE